MNQLKAPQTSLGDLDADAAGRLIAAAADVALVVDAQGVIRDLAFGNEDFTKEGYESWIGQPWTDTVTVESRPKVEALLRDAASSQAQRWRHINHHSARGTDIPLMYSAVKVGREGRALAVGRAVAFGRDLRATAALQQRLVDAQQALERDYIKLRQAETRYRHLFQVTAEAVIVVDAASYKITDANTAAINLIGNLEPVLIGSAFPAALVRDSVEPVRQMLAGVKASGKAGYVPVVLADGLTAITLSATIFRQHNGSLFLVRLIRGDGASGQLAPASANSLLLRLAARAPDALVVTDMDGLIVSANQAFIDLTQLTHEDQVRGQSLDRWLGRTGVDLSVLISNLRQRHAVRLFATTLRGEFGAASDVEISAVIMETPDPACLGFTIRDVGRRLSPQANTGRELPRSVSQLRELVGRTPLKDIVGETSDLIEQLCIETALEMTRDNRASAAEMLGLSRQSLYVKLRRYGLGDLATDSDK